MLIIFTIYLNSSSAQNCPLADEYFRFNNGWQIKVTIVLLDTQNIIQKKYHKGPGIIFRYKAIYDCPDSFDEEGIDELTWYISDSELSFKLAFTDSMNKIEGISYSFIQWGIVPKEYELIKINGSIDGNKVSNTWRISGKLEIIAGNSKKTFTRNIDFSKIFTITKGKKDKRIPAEPFYWEGKQFY